MLRDKVFKVVCILSLTYINCFFLSSFKGSFLFTSLSLLIFLLCSSIVVQGNIWLIAKLRATDIKDNIFFKIGLLLLITCSCSSLVVFLFDTGWQMIFHTFDGIIIYKACAAAALFVSFICFVYEILFLTKERELDSRVVKHLDNELVHAEINILKNELDPHFVYNSLMPLYYLIKTDVHKAELFTNKLMQVYQHFLQKRHNDFVTLSEELDFIKNYFFLLQIRFRDSLVLNIDVHPDDAISLVVPFSLQLLVENAIKHNRLDKDNPLQISIRSEKNSLIVTNTFQPPSYEVRSSRVGLSNLRTRYKILSNRSIYVLKNKEHFIVKIPLLRNTNIYGVSSNTRG